MPAAAPPDRYARVHTHISPPAPPTSRSPPPPGYYLVLREPAHGSCSAAGYSDIQTEADCEAAAVALGLSDTTAMIFINADLPSKCAHYPDGYLFWNPTAAALGSEVCGQYDRDCVCVGPAGKQLPWS